MIERIRLQNFQKHADLRLKLDPAVTTLVGRTDAGKSAVIRALRWAALNRPAGDACIKDGAEDATVTVWVDGHKVQRARGKAGNTYTLDGEVFKAFGNDVPGPIAALLNVDDINFQNQHDATFWLALSPGEVSRQLNAVVDLGAIDDCLAYLAAAQRKAAATLEVAETRLAAADAKVAELAYIIEADAALAVAEGAGQKHADLAARLALLRDLRAGAGKLAAARAQAAAVAVAGRAVTDKGAAALAAAGRLATLRALIAARDKWGVKAKAPPDIAGLTAAADAVTAVRNKTARLRALSTEYNKALATYQSAARAAGKAAGVVQDSTGGLCPVCGGPLKNTA